MVWELEGTPIGALQEEVRTWDSLELTFEIEASTLQNEFRPLLDGAGKVEEVTSSDGGYTVVDVSNGIEVSLIETERSDVRTPTTWYIQDAEEEPLGTEADLYEVTIELIAENEKAYDNSLGTLSNGELSNLPSSNEWGFALPVGTVSTPRVTSDTTRETSDGLKSIELSIVATSLQTRAFEESFSKIDAVNVVEVPDGQNLYDDASPGTRHTVDMAVPDNARTTLREDTFIVTDWETEFIPGTIAYLINLSMYPA